MCGRTVRVPDLDGTIAPLPTPEMDHGDRGLAMALDALAALESGPAVVAEIEARPAIVKPVALSAPPAVEAVPIAIPEFQESASASSPRESVDPLKDLGTIPPPLEPSKPFSAGSARPFSWSKREFSWGAGGLLVGLLIGRLSVSQRPEPVVQGGAQPVAVAGAPNDAGTKQQDVPAVPADTKRAVEGRVTYLTAMGETRADVGARVLILPVKHPAASRIATRSFQAGASAGDVKLAQAAIRSLGGDFALADAEGRYEVFLASPGKYRLLIVSRYQPRADSAPKPDLLTALQEWFDQPLLLLGQTQFLTTDIQFDGQAGSLRDHLFPRDESL